MGETSIQPLAAAIEQRFGSTPAYVGAVPVHETFEGQTVWDGTVHVFDLEDGQRCYAWAFEDEQDEAVVLRIVTTLHKPTVDSPLAAVQAAIVQQAHEGE